MIDFYGMTTRPGLFYDKGVKEFRSLFIYICIFCNYPRGTGVNVLECDIVKSEFTFGLIPLGKA